MKPLLALGAAILFAGYSTCSNAGQAKLKTLHTFCSEQSCLDGASPLAGLARDASGNLFGTTEVGGKYNDGVVFELVQKGARYKYKVLHDFCFSCGDGDFPTASVIADTGGNIYGVTLGGGPHDCGIVFEITPATKKYQTIHTFCAAAGDADEPNAALTYAGKNAGALYDGVSPLYGVTALGGAQGAGAAYELRPKNGKWRGTVVYSFCPGGGDCVDGWQPSGELLVDAGGNLFGNTKLGGAGQSGGVTYELQRHGKSWSEKVIHALCSEDNCSDGQAPSGALSMDSDGAIYGTTEDADNSESGALFKLSPNGKQWTETVLHTFCTGDCADGYLVTGGVVMDATGALYGTDELGGTGGNGVGAGVLFRFAGKKFKPLYSFCSRDGCTDGSVPMGRLLLGAGQTLFGITSQGGKSGQSAGTVFQLTP